MMEIGSRVPANSIGVLVFGSAIQGAIPARLDFASACGLRRLWSMRAVSELRDQCDGSLGQVCRPDSSAMNVVMLKIKTRNLCCIH